MNKVEDVIEANELTRGDYQKLIENLRVRLNVLNASVFLLEEKLITVDKGTLNYLKKINSELEIIRQLILPYPFQVHHKN